MIHFRFSRQFTAMLQQVAIIGFVLLMVIGATNVRIIALTVRELLLAVVFIFVLIVSSRRFRDADLLASPVDLAWGTLLFATGIAILVAPFPRRSVEIWAWTLALQIPIAYGTLYSLRRRMPVYAISRAVLVVGGLLFAAMAYLTLSYLIQAISALSHGTSISGFRPWAILDNPSVLAMFIAITTPCIVGYAFVQKKRLEQVAVLLWLIGAFIAIVGSGTRSGAIATLIGCIPALYLALLSHKAQPLANLQRWIAIHRRLATLLLVCTVGVIAIVFVVQSAAPAHGDGTDRLEEYRIALTSFVHHPLAGLGPGGFVLAEEAVHSIPPFLLVPHAHDFVLNFASDEGLLGLAGLGIFLLVIARCCLTAWRTQPERRPLLAGAIGSIVGFVAAGLFEFPFNQPGLFCLATMFIMFIAAGSPAPVRVSRLRIALIIGGMVAVGLLLLALIIPYRTLWHIVYEDAVTLSTNPTLIRTDAQSLDMLTGSDPGDPLAALQSAYAWAHLSDISVTSTESAEALNNAISRLERAISLDPYLGLHQINLSALYARAGRTQEALALAERASHSSFDDPVAWLNLGMRQEESGDQDAAQQSYLKALSLDPEWHLAAFWQTSSLRAAAVAQFVPPATLTSVSHDEQTLSEALADFHNGDLATAATILTKLANTSSSNAEVWFTLGDIASRQGNTDEMQADYDKGYQAVTARGIDGAHSVSYATNSFWRIGLVSDYLPDVPMLDATAEDIPRLKRLAELVSTDDPGAAALIYRTILQSAPNDSVALSHLGL